MEEFKVGNLVRCIEPTDHDVFNMIGMITEASNSSILTYPIKVKYINDWDLHKITGVIRIYYNGR